MPVGRKIKSEVFSYDGFGWKTPGWVTETEGAGVGMSGAGRLRDHHLGWDFRYPQAYLDMRGRGVRYPTVPKVIARSHTKSR